jgi:hypothetical protein
MAITTEFIEDLAADLGSKVYLDIAKWHLYLNDAHLHVPLAEKLAGLLSGDRLSQASVKEVLGSFTVEIGGGQKQVSLLDLVPSRCHADLMEVLEDYQNKL